MTVTHVFICLLLYAQGLKETVHPYGFVARTGFKELLEVNGSEQKAIPLLPKVCMAIRAALVGDIKLLH